MNVIYTEKFDEQLSEVRDKSIAERALAAVMKLENAKSLREVTNIKAIQGYPAFYRIRFGDFRIGFQLVDENTIRLFAIDHRSKIYRYFPKNFA